MRVEEKENQSIPNASDEASDEDNIDEGTSVAGAMESKKSMNV